MNYIIDKHCGVFCKENLKEYLKNKARESEGEDE